MNPSDSSSSGRQAPPHTPEMPPRGEELAGCLSFLGIPVVLVIVLGVAAVAVGNLQSLRNSLDWSGMAALAKSFWVWLRHGGTPMPGAVGLFVVSFLFLWWQWRKIWLCRRTSIPRRSVWMLSTLFFVTPIVTCAVVTFPGFTGHPDLATWLASNLSVSALPGVLAGFSLALWLNDGQKPARQQGANKCDDEPPY